MALEHDDSQPNENPSENPLFAGADDGDEFEGLDEMIAQAEAEDAALMRGEPLSEDEDKPADQEDDAEEDADQEEDTEESDDQEDDAEEDADQEDDAEESDEDDAEESDEDDAKKSSTPEPRIPKSRLDAKNRRIRELEEKLAAATQGLEPKDRSTETQEEEAARLDFQEELAKASDALIDNKPDEAAKILNEMFGQVYTQAQRDAVERMRKELPDEAVRRVQRDTQAAEFDAAVDQIVEKYDFFDDASDNFDRGLTDRALALQKVYLAEGLTPAEAITEAANEVVQRYKPELLADSQPPAGNGKQARKQREQQRKRAASKNAKLARQPAEAEATVDPVDKEFDIENMTEEDLDAIPESKLAELRGDFLD